MSKDDTPKFTLTLPLQVSPEEHSVLVKSQQASRKIYNAVLGEALKRLDEMRRDKRWKQAGEMKKGTEKNKAYKNLKDYYGFSKRSIEIYQKNIRNNGYLKDHINADVARPTFERAFNAVEEYLYGERGRPRFKPFQRLNSLQAKSARSDIIFNGKTVKYNTSLNKLVLPIKYDGRAKELAYVSEALENRLCFCRLVHRTIKGKNRWYVQLVLEGLPPIKEKHKKLFEQAQGKKVGIDTGPSRCAFFGEKKGQQAYLTLAEKVDYQWKEVRRLQRKLDRSRRAMNPQNYDHKGSIKRGQKLVWYKSNRYLKLEAEYREMERILTAMRFTSHGELTNIVLMMGDQVYLENVSYKAWQKLYGRSAKVRGAGMFQARVIRKALSAGGHVSLINTYTTKLSQYCHMRNDYVKKTLNDRVHVFPDGNTAHRDLYSAFLATCVVNNDTLDKDEVNKKWKAVDSRLNNPISKQALFGRKIAQSSKRGLDCKSYSGEIIADTVETRSEASY